MKSNQGNVLISPISLKLALVLLYEGAQDETAKELEKAMNLPASRSATREKYSNVLKSLQVRLTTRYLLTCFYKRITFRSNKSPTTSSIWAPGSTWTTASCLVSGTVPLPSRSTIRTSCRRTSRMRTLRPSR